MPLLTLLATGCSQMPVDSKKAPPVHQPAGFHAWGELELPEIEGMELIARDKTGSYRSQESYSRPYCIPIDPVALSVSAPVDWSPKAIATLLCRAGLSEASDPAHWEALESRAPGWYRFQNTRTGDESISQPLESVDRVEHWKSKNFASMVFVTGKRRYVYSPLERDFKRDVEENWAACIIDYQQRRYVLRIRDGLTGQAKFDLARVRAQLRQIRPKAVQGE